mgnify:CR=1 FL=1
MDLIGQIFWCAMFVTPLLTIPLAWKLIEETKPKRILIGLLLAIILSAIFFTISMEIIFRSGIGN